MAKLYFYYSAMNAGKTTTLLQSAHNYRERGMRVAILSPRLDDRAGSGKVASRIGLSAEARSEEHTSELQSLMRISYAVFCLKKKITTTASMNVNMNSGTYLHPATSLLK